MVIAMNDSYLVSIIIPIYNSEKYLKTCVNSILNQTYKNIEVILIDDGSTDESRKICEKLKNKDNRIKFIFQSNGGPSVARNNGISQAKGKYIFFCDSDDYIDSNVIEILVKNEKKCQLNGVYHYIENKKIKKLKKYKKEEYDRKKFLNNIFNGTILGTSWGFLFDKEITKNIKFNENTNCMEDTIFLIEYIKTAKIDKIIYNDLAYYHYVSNDNSITQNNKNNLQKCKNYFYSLDLINKTTKYEYESTINDLKARIVEIELENEKEKKYKLYFEILKIEKYNGKSLRYKLFTKLYINHSKCGLSIYYYLKKVAKKIMGRYRK